MNNNATQIVLSEIDNKENFYISANIEVDRFRTSVVSLLKTLETKHLIGIANPNSELHKSFMACIGRLGRLGLPADLRSNCAIISVTKKKDQDGCYGEIFSFQLTKDGLVTILAYAGYQIYTNAVFKCDSHEMTSNGWEKKLSIIFNPNDYSTGDNRWVENNICGIYVTIKKNDYSDIVFVDKTMLWKIKATAKTQAIWDRWLLQMLLKTALKYAVSRAGIPMFESNIDIKESIREDDLESIGANNNNDSMFEKISKQEPMCQARADFGFDPDRPASTETLIPISAILHFFDCVKEGHVSLEIEHQQIIVDAYIKHITLAETLADLNNAFKIYVNRGLQFNQNIGRAMFRSAIAASKKFGADVCVNTTTKEFEIPNIKDKGNG